MEVNPGYSSWAAWKRYTGVTAVIILLTILLRLIDSSPSIDLVNIALIYLFPVLFSAVYWGMGPALWAAAFGVLAFDFFYVPPFLSFTVTDLRYLISFAVFIAVAVLTARLSEQLRQQVRLAREREASTASLYDISRQLTAITDIKELLSNVASQIAMDLNTQTVLYVQSEQRESLEIVVHAPVDSTWGSTESELVIANWVYQNRKRAGKGSTLLPEAVGMYLPLSIDDQIYGVLGVHLGRGISSEDQRMIEALAGIAASAIARTKLAEEAKLAHLTAESERLRTAILDSVSHELRTPLAAIIGSASGLLEGDALFTSEERKELLVTIREGALRMNRLVSNLLGMVRLESGMLGLRREWCDIQDILGVVLAQVKEDQLQRKIHVEIDPDTPFIQGDEILIEQVLVNVLSNSIKYSPDGSEIRLQVQCFPSKLSIIISDQGIGIIAAESEQIFDKFYRSHRAQHLPGTGLGLAICKGIIEAHEGTITAEPNRPQGTIIRIELPLKELEEGKIEREEEM
ncbi:two-component system sensor histidine kinase KdpD [Paenibacillus shirakamiensis]|uniref:histidine kinase n=1 Tax=Paenibacillus shirakamiensis TaxID=1265935 RepID=A0ABS4JL21_9BACL|nr:DUF4118 domain-containing protein [Paenibacillus shirakamiensis]MBP2002408.1 two-component system sensor histidine kinase KdpD [Paenibacillus shirakamiensis]